MTAIRGSAAAVTGAASGIGRALAIELASRGCDLALADRDEAGLQAVAAEIAQAHARKVSVHRVDVGEASQIAAFAQAAISAHPSLNILVNNAGVALLGQFHEIDQAQMDWLMNINFWGVVHSTRAFLAHLSTRREAHIVNLSSIFGIVAPPGQTAYAAAKFAVRGFSESLRHELQMAASPVRLSVVHPGGVLTGCGCRASDRPRHREEPAAHPDRRRRPLHGPVAALPARHLLERDGQADREGGEQGEVTSSYPAKAGDPVRWDLSIPSLVSLEYWIARFRGR